MRVIRKSAHFVAYYASLAFFAILSLGLNGFCVLFGWLPGLAGKERFFQSLVHFNFRLITRWLTLTGVIPVRYVGFEHWPKHSGLIVAANHPGLMDVGWLLARIPEAACIYKPAIQSSPLYGAIARRAGYLSSNCGHHLLRDASAKVSAGQTLLVFPEGTRSRNGNLNPLKPGFVAIARLAGAPIQLVRIACDSELLTKQHRWWRAPSLPARVTLTLGPCLPSPDADTEAVIEEIERWFRCPSAFSACTLAESQARSQLAAKT